MLEAFPVTGEIGTSKSLIIQLANYSKTVMGMVPQEGCLCSSTGVLFLITVHIHSESSYCQAL
ncbi:protein of unknown function [Serratia sp. Tan611]|nr:protein of unknown function [Serratia sp. Tan611]